MFVSHIGVAVVEEWMKGSSQVFLQVQWHAALNYIIRRSLQCARVTSFLNLWESIEEMVESGQYYLILILQPEKFVLGCHLCRHLYADTNICNSVL